MKTLYELRRNETGVIRKIHSHKELKERLISFGITRGSEVTLKNCNANRENIEVWIDGTFLALRKSEAKSIEVEE